MILFVRRESVANSCAHLPLSFASFFFSSFIFLALPSRVRPIHPSRLVPRFHVAPFNSSRVSAAVADEPEDQLSFAAGKTSIRIDLVSDVLVASARPKMPTNGVFFLLSLLRGAV